MNPHQFTDMMIWYYRSSQHLNELQDCLVCSIPVHNVKTSCEEKCYMFSLKFGIPWDHMTDVHVQLKKLGEPLEIALRI